MNSTTAALIFFALAAAANVAGDILIPAPVEVHQPMRGPK